MQKLLSSVSTGLKNTPQTVAFCPVKDILQRPCQLIAIFHAWRSFLLFQPFAFILTLFDNYPIFQRTHFNVF